MSPVRFGASGGTGGGGDCPPTGTADDIVAVVDDLNISLPRPDTFAAGDRFGASQTTLADTAGLSDDMIPAVGPLGLVRADTFGAAENLLAVNLVDVAPTMDAWTDGDSTGTNHGSDTTLSISSGILGVQPERFAFLAWDFTSMDAFGEVSGSTDLTLTLFFQTPLVETPFSMRMDGLVQSSQPWVESTINHSNAPAHPQTGVATLAFPLLAGSGDRTVTLSEIDVSDVLGNWLSLRVQMSGLVEIGEFAIRSREFGTVTDRPRMDWQMEKQL